MSSEESSVAESAAPPDAARLAEEIFEAVAAELAAEAEPQPAATYRMQFNHTFRFADAIPLVAYLHELGITDLYASPYLAARPGSMHGYDVFDHTRLNPEIGSESEHARLAEELRARGMGQVLDIVPNHMGIAGNNRWWIDVLESGQFSPHARFFDIDWQPVKDELRGKILLPVLGDQYGRVLERGELVLGFDAECGAFFLNYYERRFPIAPWSYARILGSGPHSLADELGESDERAMEYQSIIWESSKLHADASPETMAEAQREKEVIKRRLARLCSECPAVRRLIEDRVRRLNGTPEVARSFDGLHEILEEQVYRLSAWRTAAEEINYRRFFDINDLGALRIEDPIVFEAIHRLIFRWLREGKITGLRVDHPDGLAWPGDYFRRIQERFFLIRCQTWWEKEGCRRPTAAREGEAGEELPRASSLPPALEVLLRRRYRKLLGEGKHQILHRPLFLVAEKILSKGEGLPAYWAVRGTVGYEAMNLLGGIFVDAAAQADLDRIYAEWIGETPPRFPEVVYEGKRLIMRSAMASELNVLARQLNRISERDRRSRDFTLNDLRRALREVIACFPVYRTYINPALGVGEQDQAYIDQALARARRRNPSIDQSVFEFIRDILLLRYPEGIAREEIRERMAFVTKFQQCTGPIQAKGVEDTAFYRANRLVSLNEVGGDPGQFGISLATFHRQNQQRLADWPGTLVATSTHDTKRSEDVRMRLHVLSELPDEWRTHLARWSRWNAQHKTILDDAPAPDANEEYLFYQSLLGVWPLEPADEAGHGPLVERLKAYMLKALKEAKVHTSWTNADSDYDRAVERFVEAALTRPAANPFLADFLAFQRRVAHFGLYNSLSQTLLKTVVPGVPDFYQGAELWDFSLVDPDNRRPVDYARRRAALDALRERLGSGAPRGELARELLETMPDGRIKLYTIRTALHYRRAHPRLFARGDYLGLDAVGSRKPHVCALARQADGEAAIAVAPRLAAGLLERAEDRVPLGEAVWSDTTLPLPPGLRARAWHNLLTDERLTPDGEGRLRLADVFAAFPVALLIAE